jgi:hypothetical protein
VHLLGFYLLIEFGALFASMLSTILLYVQRSTLIDKVIDFNKDWDDAKKEEMKKVLNGNIKNVFVAMLFFTLVLVSAQQHIQTYWIGWSIHHWLVLQKLGEGTNIGPEG